MLFRLQLSDHPSLLALAVGSLVVHLLQHYICNMSKRNDSKYLQQYKETIEEAAKEYKTIVHKSVELFEKQLSYISAGALGLSFIIVEKIFDNISATSEKGILISSWVLLTFTLILNLFSHNYATKCHLKTMEEMYDFTIGNTEEYDDCDSKKRTRNINNINAISLLSLSLGLICLILYTSINITCMSNPKKQQGQKKEVPIKSGKSRTAALNEGKTPKDSKVHEIRSGGHPGVPTKKPNKK